VSAGWVAGTVRARAMARRRLGRQAAHELASQPSLATALALLSTSAYGRDLQGLSRLADAQRAVAATALWHLRILAGWLPPGGADQLRAVAAWYELANIEDRLASLAGDDVAQPFELGALASSWRRVSPGSSVSAVRSGLAASPWGDPGADEIGPIGVALRMAWARRLASDAAGASSWAAGRGALLVAGILAGGLRSGKGTTPGQALPGGAVASARRLLGSGWQDASTLAELTTRLPGSAAWALEGTTAPEDLWRAELGWWNRVESDGLTARTATAGPGPEPVVGMAAALVADAWRVGAALEAAARGGDPGLADALA